MNPRFVWPSVVLAVLGAALAAVMAIFKIPTDTIVLVASLMVVPVLTALISAQISEIKGTANQISTQVNGNLSRLLDLVEKQSGMLAQSTPPASTTEERKDS